LVTDAHPKLGPRNWKIDLGRAALGGIGSVAALSVAQWPSNAAEAAWAGVAGLILGLVVAFGVEYLVRLRIAVRHLGTLEQQLAAEMDARVEERKLHERLLLIERRRVAVAEVDIEIWGGAYNETAKTGHVLPLSAIMARREVTLKARNLDLPLPPET